MNDLNNEKSRLYELDVIRSIACLSVVLLHSIKNHIGYGLIPSTLKEHLLQNISGLLSSGTAIFVFLSVFLIAYTSPHGLKGSFLKKKIHLVLIPFIVMALFYATYTNLNDLNNIPKTFVANLFGGFHGWFILVLFQFYVAYQILTKYLNRIKLSKLLVFSFVLNILVLIVFTLTKPPTENIIIHFIWDRGFWILLPSWIFYFSLAYTIGRNYERSITLFKNNKFKIYLSFAISLILVLSVNSLNIFSYGSKRPDMILFTTFTLLMLLLIFKGTKSVNPTVKVISKYSFGIYLLHMFYLELSTIIIEKLTLPLGVFDIVWNFAFAIIGSIASVKILNKVPFGKYIAGSNGKEVYKRPKNVTQSKSA